MSGSPTARLDPISSVTFVADFVSLVLNAMASPRTTEIYWSEQVIRIGELRFEIVLADSSMPPPGANWVFDDALHELSERLRSFKIGHMPLIT